MLAAQKVKTGAIPVLALIIFLAESAPAIPTDTLDFSIAKYIKRCQILLPEDVKYVCVNSSRSEAYPWAVVTRNKLLFYNRMGVLDGEQPLPPAKDYKITESARGQYLLIRGLKTNRLVEFERLYKSDGSLIFESELGSGADGGIFATPVEVSNYVLTVDGGGVLITSFGGDTLAARVLHDTAFYEDGDIVAAPRRDGKRIYVASNRFKFPRQSDTAGVIFYRLTRELKEEVMVALPYLLARDISCTTNGEYVALTTELEDGTTPMMILDSNGREVFRLSNPAYAKFSDDMSYLLLVPRMGPPDIIDIEDWQTYFRPSNIIPRFPWVDVDIALGKYSILFDSNDLYLVDIGQKRWGKAPFPFAFSRCRIYGNGRRIILSGQFGFVVYDRLR